MGCLTQVFFLKLTQRSTKVATSWNLVYLEEENVSRACFTEALLGIVQGVDMPQVPLKVESYLTLGAHMECLHEKLMQHS